MKHIGLFDSGINPIKPGGLTETEIAQMEATGWVKKITTRAHKDLTVVFADTAAPGGISLRKVDLPQGVAFLYNQREGSAILQDCGNPVDDDFVLPDPDVGSVPPTPPTDSPPDIP